MITEKEKKQKTELYKQQLKERIEELLKYQESGFDKFPSLTTHSIKVNAYMLDKLSRGN